MSTPLHHRRILLGVSGGIAERNRPAAFLVEALERLDQVAEECVTSHLAVGDHVEPGGLLQGDGFVHGAILDPLERRRREIAALDLPARVLQPLGPQQTAHDVTPPDAHSMPP